MLKLLRYLKPYWKTAILAPALMFVEVYAELLQPTLLAVIVDQGIPSGDLPLIIHTGLRMLGVALLGLIGGYGAVLASSTAGMHYGADLRQALFGKVQQFSFTNLDRFSTSSLITRLTNDVLQLQHLVLMGLRALVRAPLLSIGGTIMALALNPRLTSILLLAIFLVGVLLTILIARAFPYFAVVQEKLDKVNGVLQENLAGVRVVKAYGRSAKENERFRVASRDLRDTSVTASRLMAMTRPAMMLIINLSIVAIIWFGGIQVNLGGMKVGQVIAYISYMTQILFSLLMVSFILMMVSRAKVSADRINAVLDTAVDITDSPDARQEPIGSGRVEFDRVSFRYTGAGGKPVLRQISFTAAPGETVAILGSTGAGKSTLVNLIPRLYDPTEGVVRVDGTDVREFNLGTLRRGIGVVLQNTILFTGSVRDNLRLGKEDATDDELEAAAQIAQAHEFIQRLPGGYDANLEQMGVNLSGGQKQRLAIARALVKQPSILILDDSTSAVDMGTEARIQAALKERLAGTTVLIVAQRINSVMDADKIIVLEDGQIAAVGTHTELLATSPLYQDIYHSQIREEVGQSA